MKKILVLIFFITTSAFGQTYISNATGVGNNSCVLSISPLTAGDTLIVSTYTDGASPTISDNQFDQINPGLWPPPYSVLGGADYWTYTCDSTLVGACADANTGPNSMWISANTAPPHYIIINFGASKTFNFIRLHPHQTNSVATDYTLNVSSDGLNWGSVVEISPTYPASTVADQDWPLSTTYTTQYIKVTATAASPNLVSLDQIRIRAPNSWDYHCDTNGGKRQCVDANGYLAGVDENFWLATAATGVITVDMNSAKTFTELRITPGSGLSKNYTLDVNNAADCSTWTNGVETSPTFTPSSGTEQVWTLSTSYTKRCFRVNITASGNANASIGLLKAGTTSTSTFTTIPGYPNTFNSFHLGAWLAPVSVSGIGADLITISSAGSTFRCGVLQYSGLTASPLDKYAGANYTSTTSLASGTTALTQSNELLVGVFGNGATTYTAGASYTKRFPTGSESLMMETQNVAPAGTYQATATGGGNVTGSGLIITLKTSGSVGGNVRHKSQVY